MFLKGCIPGLLMMLFASCAFAQPSTAESDSANVQQKIHLIKSGLEDEFDEDQFRSIYLEFLSEKKKNIRCSFLTLNNLAKLASGDEANTEFFDCLNSLLVYNAREIRIREKYFNRISREMNGLVALQFLEVEGPLHFRGLSDPLDQPQISSGSALTDTPVRTTFQLHIHRKDPFGMSNGRGLSHQYFRSASDDWSRLFSSGKRTEKCLQKPLNSGQFDYTKASFSAKKILYCSAIPPLA